MPLPNSPFTRPVPVMAIGDSIIANNHGGSGVQLYTHNYGEVSWAQNLLWGEIAWEVWPASGDPVATNYWASNRGVPGQSTGQVHTRIQRDMISWAPKIGIYATAVNDLWGSGTAAIALANTKSDVLAMANAGIYTLVATCRPWSTAYDQFVIGGAATGQNKVVAYNSGIRSWVSGLNNPRIRLWDVAADAYGMVEGLDTTSGTYLDSSGASRKSASVTAWLYADGAYQVDGQLHPGNGYAYLGGKSLAARLQALGWVRTVTSSANFFKQIILPGSLGILSDAASKLTGSTAVSGTITGNRPSSWTLTASGVVGGSTAAASLVSNSESGGQSFVLTVTPGGTSGTDTWIMSATLVQTVPAWAQLIFEVEFDASPYWIGAQALLTIAGGGATRNVLGQFLSDTKPGYPEARRYSLICPALQANGAPTSMSPAIWIKGAPRGDATPATVKVHRVYLGNRGSPKGLFHQ